MVVGIQSGCLCIVDSSIVMARVAGNCSCLCLESQESIVPHVFSLGEDQNLKYSFS